MVPALRLRLVAIALIALIVVACGGGSMAPTAAPTNPIAAALAIDGNPESASGALWHIATTIDGVTYDLAGILLKPSGNGPFPAVVISHGSGGSATGYSRSVAREMVQWGLVCIATNYTHAGGVAIGSPGSATQPGASVSNVLRAHLARDILGVLSYVDASRVAAHGHSMGAFVTSAVVSAYPGDFRAASHSAGGFRPDGTPDVLAAPTESQVRAIRTPYQLHHGDADLIVLPLFDQLLSGILAVSGVEHELYMYSGGHNDVSLNATMLTRVREWYRRHGIL